MATVLGLGRCPTEQRGTMESSISQSKHTNRNTHESSQAYSHTNSHATLHIKSNKIYFATKHRLSFLHNSAIWSWWGSSPRAPDVETPLLPPTDITYNQPPIIISPSLDRLTEQTFITLNLNSTL